MQNNVIKKDLDKDFVAQLQQADYAAILLKENFTALCDMHKYDEGFLETPVAKDLLQKQSDTQKEFVALKDRVEKEMVPAELNGHKFDWSVDYETAVLTITILCDCGIEAAKELFEE